MAAPTYVQWKEGAGSRFPVEAEKAHAEIEAISERNGGAATPELIVDASRSHNSVLHGCFDWNDASAGEKYRKAQARDLLRSIEIRFDRAPEILTRAFEVVSVPSVGRGYRDVQRIMEEPIQRDELLDRALKELESIRRRYSTLTELKAVFMAIDATWQASRG